MLSIILIIVDNKQAVVYVYVNVLSIGIYLY